MKKEIALAGMLAFVCTGLAYAEDSTTAADPMASYYYRVPANTWYAAKVKPKFDMRAKARLKPDQPVAPVAAPDPVNTPVARPIEPPRALPFWHELPAQKK